MSTNSRLFRYLSSNSLRELGTFWLIIIIVNVFLTSIFALSSIEIDLILGNVIINEEVMSVAGSNTFAVFVFFIIYGIVMLHQNFPLTAGFGVTRKNFYINVIVNNIMIALMSGVIQIILIKMDNIVISNLGHEPMVEFGLFNMNDSIILNILLVSFVFLVFTSLTNLLGVLQYRFGVKFWIGLGVFVFVMTLFGSSIGILFRGLFEIASVIANGGILIGIVVILLAYIIGFMLIRRVIVK